MTRTERGVPLRGVLSFHCGARQQIQEERRPSVEGLYLVKKILLESFSMSPFGGIYRLTEK